MLILEIRFIIFSIQWLTRRPIGLVIASSREAFEEGLIYDLGRKSEIAIWRRKYELSSNGRGVITRCLTTYEPTFSGQLKETAPLAP
jgi:chorismate-pyruvate lyase